MCTTNAGKCSLWISMQLQRNQTKFETFSEYSLRHVQIELSWKFLNFYSSAEKLFVACDLNQILMPYNAWYFVWYVGNVNLCSRYNRSFNLHSVWFGSANCISKLLSNNLIFCWIVIYPLPKSLWKCHSLNQHYSDCVRAARSNIGTR